MKRPARRRSSPMELAPRLNPQAQQHCDAFSKHGLWRKKDDGKFTRQFCPNKEIIRRQQRDIMLKPSPPSNS